jgi:MYXO-CTERM domain-containing protein
MNGPVAASGVRILLLLAALSAVPLASAQGPPSAMPEQPHVTLYEDGVVVHFALSGAKYGANEQPQVRATVAGGAETTYPAYFVGEVVPVGSTDIFSTAVYAAQVPADPGDEVVYQYGDATRGFAAAVTTRMPDGGPLRFVAMGDIGYDGVAADGSQASGADSAPIAMRDLAIAQDPELLVIPGDLSYLNTRAGWDRYMRMHAPLQSTVPTMPAIGNHEWEPGPGYGQFLAEYWLPGNEQDFTFRVGEATFIAINSDNLCNGVQHRSGASLLDPCPEGLVESRMQFVRQALADADSDGTAWTIVYMHHPPYSWGRHGNDWAAHVYLAPLFQEHEVDLVVTAHDHLYSRTYPVIDRQPQANGSAYEKGDGPVYVVLGGGGRELYTASGDTPPAWLAKGESVHHLGVFDVDADQIAYRAIRRDGSELDAFTITAPTGVADLLEDPIPVPAWLAVAGVVAAGLLRRRR